MKKIEICMGAYSNFLNADTENKISAAVIGRRKREIGLVVPAKYKARTKNKKIALTLQKYLLSKLEGGGLFKMCDFHHIHRIRFRPHGGLFEGGGLL